jgi:hypothetical protein
MVVRYVERYVPSSFAIDHFIGYCSIEITVMYNDKPHIKYRRYWVEDRGIDNAERLKAINMQIAREHVLRQAMIIGGV